MSPRKNAKPSTSASSKEDEVSLVGKLPESVEKSASGSVSILRNKHNQWLGCAFFALAVIAVAGGTTWFKLNSRKSIPSTASAVSEKPVADTGPEAGFAGSSSCGECHVSITKSFQHIAMGRSLYRPTDSNIIENYTTGSEFYHKASRQYFKMTHEDGKFYQSRFQKDESGNKINEMKVRIDYVVGSGNHARSYIHEEPGGKLYQLPVAWYSQENRWAMEPGYDTAQQMGFSRRISYDCISCHAALPVVPPGADKFNYAETSFFPNELSAIDCERCHGPAQHHVDLAHRKAAVAEIKAAIINPANLAPERELETCMQCHLETTSGKLPHDVNMPGHAIFSYRPGQPLGENRVAFDHPKGTGYDDKFEIAGQAYRMRMSRCYIESGGKMTCTTCHDPHTVPTDRIAAGIESCQVCHKLSDCTEKPELRAAVADNCIQCHMPQRRTDDAIHVVMTDHYIQRRPPPEKQLIAPRHEVFRDYKGKLALYYPPKLSEEMHDLAFGLGYISDGTDVSTGVELLSQFLKKKPDVFEAVYTRGVAFKILGNLDSAQADLERAVSLLPNNPQAQMALADLYEQKRDFTNSAACYQKAITIDSRVSRAHNGLGTSLLLANDLAGAEKAFHDAMASDPFDENAPLNLAGIYMRQNDPVKAEATNKIALAINPSNADGWLGLAQSLAAQSRYQDAIQSVFEASAINPNLDAAFQLLEQCSAQLAFADQEKILTSSTVALPFGGRALFARFLADTGQKSRALAVLHDIPTTGTASSAELAFCAQMGLRLNLKAQAMDWARQAHQMSPDSEDATIWLAAALHASSQEAEANQLLVERLKIQETPQLLNARAWLLATAKSPSLADGSTAEALVNQAVSIMGKPNVHTLSTLAAAQAQQERFSDASHSIDQAIEMAKTLNDSALNEKLQAQKAAYQASQKYVAEW